MKLVETTIVVVGSLNPAILSPAWLRRYRIADEAEIAAAETEHREELLIAPAVGLARMRCRSFTLTCTSDRLTTSVTAPEHRDLLRQVVSRVFQQLGHTPVRAVGFNFHGEWEPEAGDEVAVRVRGLFAADPSRLDGIFPEGWELAARVRSRSEWPRMTLSVRPDDARLRLDTNFHYEGDRLSSGVQVPDLIRERFGDDQQKHETLAETLIGS